MLGKYEYHGKIQASVQFDYFPYPVNDKNRLTTDILSEVCPLAEEWELLREPVSYTHLDVYKRQVLKPLHSQNVMSFQLAG